MRLWHQPVSPDIHLVGVFGVDLRGAARYALTVLALFGLYATALYLVLREGAHPRPVAVFGVAGACCALVALTHPLTSEDLFNYMAGARIAWVHGDNPLVAAPKLYPEDPFVRLVRNWREIPSPYGPLWTLLTAIPLAVGGGKVVTTIVAFKAMSAGFLLAAGRLVWLTADRLRPGTGPAAALALLWNPFVVWHVAGNGHNDAVMACLLALCAYLLVRSAVAGAVVAFAAAVLVKFAPLLLLPLLLVWWWWSGRRPEWRALAPGLVLSAALAVAAYAPFWAGPATFRTALDEGSYFTVSSPAALRGLLLRWTDTGTAETLASWCGRLAFLGAYATLLLRLRGGRIDALLEGAALTLLLYLALAATYFAPWYVLWPLTLACAVPWRRAGLWPALALSLTSMSVLVWAAWARVRWADSPSGDWLPMHVLSAAAIAPPVLVAWLLWLSGCLHSSADIDAPVLHQQVARARVER